MGSTSGSSPTCAGGLVTLGPGVTLTSTVDARWLMAFAASVGDTKPAHIDTAARGGIVGHPLFAVCVEWPVLASSRIENLGGHFGGPSPVLHATHDMTVHRLVRPGDTLSTSHSVIGIESKTPGVLVHQLLETVDGDGRPVATTRYGALALGRRMERPDVPPVGHAPPVWDWPSDSSEIREKAIALGAGAAHVYTEGARIFNPIHTDRAVALAAGLEQPVLHGTATLALAVSTIVDHACDGDPESVARVAGRFVSMVTLPCVLRIRWLGRRRHVISFQVLGPGSTVVVDRGVIIRRDDTA